jgi:hypothetical protein
VDGAGAKAKLSRSAPSHAPSGGIHLLRGDEPAARLPRGGAYVKGLSTTPSGSKLFLAVVDLLRAILILFVLEVFRRRKRLPLIELALVILLSLFTHRLLRFVSHPAGLPCGDKAKDKRGSRSVHDANL